MDNSPASKPVDTAEAIRAFELLFSTSPEWRAIERELVRLRSVEGDYETLRMRLAGETAENIDAAKAWAARCTCRQMLIPSGAACVDTSDGVVHFRAVHCFVRQPQTTRECCHDLQKPDHTMTMKHDLREGMQFASTATCQVCGETFRHPMAYALKAPAKHITNHAGDCIPSCGACAQQVKTTESRDGKG